MTEGDGYWNKKLKEYVKLRGLKDQSQFPIKEFLLHRELDRIHQDAYDAAWDALQARNANFTPLGREVQYRNWQLQGGDAEGAADTQKSVNSFIKKTKFK